HRVVLAVLSGNGRQHAVSLVQKLAARDVVGRAKRAAEDRSVREREPAALERRLRRTEPLRVAVRHALHALARRERVELLDEVTALPALRHDADAGPREGVLDTLPRLLAGPERQVPVDLVGARVVDRASIGVEPIA